MSVKEKVDLLLKALDGAESTNQALANCDDVEEMMNLLLVEADKNGLDLTKDDLMKTPPIRDWIWFAHQLNECVSKLLGSAFNNRSTSPSAMTILTDISIRYNLSKEFNCGN